MIASAGPNLRVYRETVLTGVTLSDVVTGGSQTQSSKVTSATAVQRTPTEAAQCGGYGSRLSEMLPDWYSAVPSKQFDKKVRVVHNPMMQLKQSVVW
jgi:hypothetical protein